LEFCFQGFNALERADDRYFEVKATTPLSRAVADANTAPEIASLDYDQPEIPSPDLYQDEFVPGAPSIDRSIVRRPVIVPTAHVASIRIERKQERPVFHTVRITYPQPAPPAIASEPQKTITVARVERREVKERSLVARALPIVKKPLDLFKFVGSKLR
jgi:hypothetical protein